MTDSPIAEIKSKLDISDILSEYISLKPAGSHSLKALCPFHNEKTPSFMVSRDKQIWHCFGCSKGGDMFTFVQEYEGISFPEALRQLAQKAGVKLTPQNPVKANQKTKILNINELTSSYFHQYLLKKSEAKIAREYLKSREVSTESIDLYRIGYAPNSWDELNNFLIKRGFTAQEIFEAGITTKNSAGKFFDRFRDRLIFPIFDHSNSIVGFGGRTLKDDKKEAKYINSPQTLVYDKSQVLYGLNFAKGEIKKKKLAVIVEGYLDVISSHQAGVLNVVASSGTALTAQQITLLGRYSKEIALSFDSDQAGQDAAKRGIETALQAGFDIKVITIPEGKDPDDCIKSDPEKWKTAIADAQEFIQYYFKQTTLEVDISEPKGKKEASDILLPMIKKISDVVEKSFWLKKLANILDVEEGILRDKLKQVDTPKLKPKPVVVQSVPKKEPIIKENIEPKTKQELVCELLLLTIILNPPLLEYTSKHITPEKLAGKDNQELYKSLIIYYTDTNSDYGNFVEYLQNQSEKLLCKFNTLELLADKEFENISTQDIKIENIRLVDEIKENYILKKRKELQNKMMSAELSGDIQKIESLTKEFNNLV